MTDIKGNIVNAPKVAMNFKLKFELESYIILQNRPWLMSMYTA